MSGIREYGVNVALSCCSLIPGTSCLARQCSVSDIPMALEGASAPCSGVVPPWNNAAIPASALRARPWWSEAELSVQAESVRVSRGDAEAAERSLAHEAPI